MDRAAIQERLDAAAAAAAAEPPRAPALPLSAQPRADQVERIQRQDLHHRDMPWPRGQLWFRLRILTTAQAQAATAAAWARLKEIGIPVQPATAEYLAEETIVQRLWRAMHELRDDGAGGRQLGGPLFASADDLRDLLTEAERYALGWALQALQADCDPLANEQLDADTLDAIEDAVKKKDKTLLSGFGSSVLATYLTTTASPPSP